MGNRRRTRRAVPDVAGFPSACCVHLDQHIPGLDVHVGHQRALMRVDYNNSAAQLSLSWLRRNAARTNGVTARYCVST